MATAPAIHWLRENAGERSPHRLFVLDTETRMLDPERPDEQVLRLWRATLVRRHATEPPKSRREAFAGTTVAELVAAIEGVARSDVTTWLYSHNLNFDLAVTALPVALVEAGWSITEGALTTDDPWCRMRKGSRRLTIVDSWSQLPTSVEALGSLLGLAKVTDLRPDDADAAWGIRCEVDVEIVTRALVELMDWWDEGRYGNWSITGPATGWSSYRHRRPAPRVLVDPDPVARSLEARAVTGGRRDARRLGRQPAGLYADLDIATAHLTVMANLPLPARRMRAFSTLSLDAHELRSDLLDVLAEVELETASPRYPWDSGHGIFYPTGRFRAVLAGPEIRAALARGELRSIGRGYTYLLSAHMADWARWVRTLLDPATPDVPPVVALMAKQWSRAVPGKWAGHTSEVIGKVPDPRPGWQVERGFIVAGHRPADWLRIGGELWTIARDLWADDAFPAILAWIQSHTRLSLNTLVDALGSAVLSCNTDGLIVDARRVVLSADELRAHDAHYDRGLLAWLDDACRELSERIEPFAVRVKSTARRVEILSPQHVVWDADKRLSGVPRKAAEIGDHEYAFTAWPKLRIQIGRDAGPGYTTRQSTVRLANVPVAGWRNLAGSVTPIEVRRGADGRDAICPPDGPGGPGGGLEPPERQHPVLRAVLARVARAEAG